MNVRPVTRRAWLTAAALVMTFATLRVFLHVSPGTNLDVAGYNIHHLFTGLVLIVLGGIPLAALEGRGRALDVSALVFGAGLAMALDEWVYLIVTDGSDASYLLPVSLWGGAAAVGLAVVYLAIVAARARAVSGDDR